MTPVAVAYQHVREEPPSPTSLNPDITPALASVLTKALAKDKARPKRVISPPCAGHYDGYCVTNDESTTVIPPP